MTTFNKYFKREKGSPGLGKDSGRFWTFRPKGQKFVYPEQSRAIFLSIHPRIKFLDTKLIEIENHGLIPGLPVCPFSVCLDDIQNGSSFYNIHPRIKCL